jgi:hypothetical protein
MANAEYWKFAESERHFNTTQADIRKHAATWMLAAFGAIAILLKSSGDFRWVVSPAILVCTVSAMATIGLLVLWINDQLVYQRLLDCGFIVALKMEYDNPELPPVRWMMMYVAEGKGMSRWMTYFYTIPMWGLLAISTTTTLLRDEIQALTQGAVSGYGVMIMAGLCVTQGFAVLWVQFKKKEVGASNRAALFGDREFEMLFVGDEAARSRIANVIRRYKPRTTPIGAEEEG